MTGGQGRFLLLLMLCVISFGQDALGGKLYKWVDEEGVVHFSDRVPGDGNVMEDLIHEEDVQDVPPLKPPGKSAPRTPQTPIEHTVDSTFTIKGTRSLGTGFFISSNGYAVTCRHVIEEDGDHRAVLNDRSEYPIGVISKSDRYDLALILVMIPRKTSFLSPRDLHAMTPGERLFAIGSSVGLQSTVTDGVLTGLRKKMPTEQKVIQFSAPINPGNSGGPLIDQEGHVLGVVSWKIVANKGIPVSGVGFAVPAEYLIEEYGAYAERTISTGDTE